MAALRFPAVVSFHSATLPQERKGYIVFNEKAARMYVQNSNLPLFVKLIAFYE